MRQAGFSLLAGMIAGLAGPAAASTLVSCSENTAESPDPGRVTRDWDANRAALHAGEPTAMLYGWTGDNGDADDILNVPLGCQAAALGGANLTRWCEPAYDADIRVARRTDDCGIRIRLYDAAQERSREALPQVPLTHIVVRMAARRTVAGFRMDPRGRYLFEGVHLSDKP